MGCDLELSASHNGEFIERRSLPRFGPAPGTDHSRDADRRGASVHPTKKFFDNLGWMSFSLNSNRCRNDTSHRMNNCRPLITTGSSCKGRSCTDKTARKAALDLTPRRKALRIRRREILLILR